MTAKAGTMLLALKRMDFIEGNYKRKATSQLRGEFGVYARTKKPPDRDAGINGPDKLCVLNFPEPHFGRRFLYRTRGIRIGIGFREFVNVLINPETSE